MATTLPMLTPNARTVLAHRYLRKDAQGQVVETPEEMFRRVARVIAAVDQRYDPHLDVEAQTAQYYELMAELRFLPNSPTLMNAGLPLGQLAACFVLPVADDLDSIFNAVRDAARIHQSGGGVGYDFSRLRPQHDAVRSTGGVASGPVSFMQVFDQATEVIKQGGRRRGANMGVLRVDHPDILTFIHAKDQEGVLTNFNLSVGATDAFMAAVERNAAFPLRHPRTGAVVHTMPARALLEEIAAAAWRGGDPGMLFLDTINRHNPIPHVGAIEATNPCVTGDSRVWVEYAGLIPIRELVGTTPRIATQVDGRVAFQKAIRVVRTGVYPILRLKTREGYELRLTADHRVITEGGEIPAGALQPGDRVHLLAAPTPSVSKTSRDARLGEVVGWLTGDGHFTLHEGNKPTVVLNFYGNDKQEVAKHLLDTARELIGDPHLRLNSVTSRDLAYIRSQRLRNTLTQLGVDNRCKREVPELVWRGSADLVAGYLRALFSADGSVQGRLAKGLSVRLASNELTLLRDVQQLLLRLGIRSVLYPNRRVEGRRFLPDAKDEPRAYICAAQHELSVSRASLLAYVHTIGFLIAAKQEALQEKSAQYRRGPYRDTCFATVSDIVPESEEEVFDLTEPVTSRFFANGLLVHNCGEQPLLPYESCILGSVNLARCVRHGALDWPEVRRIVRLAVQFLDNVIDANQYPLPQIAAMSTSIRKIGLGVMGWADLLIQLAMPYTDPQALTLAETLMRTITDEARQRSAELGRERGSFPYFPGSRWEQQGYAAMRNATVTTIAPTGTLSIIAGTSSGIEPLFAVAYVRQGLDGVALPEVNPYFLQQTQAAGLPTGVLLDQIAQQGSVQHLAEVPEAIRRIFVTALDISPEWHVRMQAAFQRATDNAVSKTVNLPNSATVEEVLSVYRLAHALGCKGITVFRDGSRSQQVLYQGKIPSLCRADGPVTAHAEYGGECKLCSV